MHGPHINLIAFRWSAWIRAVYINAKRYRIMTGNDISSLNPTNFSAYPNLETLVLNDNQLTVIPIGALENLPRLINLWAINKIKINDHNFGFCSTLDGNPLMTIEDEAFSNLTVLEQLWVEILTSKDTTNQAVSNSIHRYIRRTSLATLNGSVFEGLSSLQGL